MSVDLFAHNRTAYENAVEMLESHGRAAVIHPTGTGKSFIAFKLAEEHPGKKVLWLAPGECIFRSQKENYLEAGGDENTLADITFMTYQKLMYGMNPGAEEDETQAAQKELLRKVLRNAGMQEKSAAAGMQEAPPQDGAWDPDYIILDEFHRCGAWSWGRCVERLLSACPGAQVLGLSATHIRYLDNRRDMAQELFGGKIASRMELTQALALGILPTPLYVCGLYEYGRELDRLAKRIDLQRNGGVREKSSKLYEKLKRALEQAKGPAEIFAKYMKKDGKYIVFCAGREHMKEMMGLAGEWYGRVDKEPAIYRAIYDSGETPREVKRFREDKSGHLKLLFCVDMLNEGIHVPEVDGAVLLRPTASPTLYLQQVGRALATGGKCGGQPVIFDMVDNFDGLKCIDSFLEEYRRAGRGDRKGKEKAGQDFLLVDEARESRELFERLGRTLASSWEECFAQAKEYYRIHGNLRVPKAYITENGISLGSWLVTQRRVRAGEVPGILTKEQTEKLDSLGMDWDCSAGKVWERGYRELVKFWQENGHADVPSRYVTKDGYPLGRFVGNQRQAWKNGRAERGGRTLSKEREQKLNELGFVWEKLRQERERYFDAAVAFYEREGHLDVPFRFVTEDGRKLGLWLGNTRALKKMLTPAQLAKLEEMGLRTESSGDARWEKHFMLAKHYYEEHGNLEVPRDYTVEGVRLGRWIGAMRSTREHPGNNNYRLDEERIRRLEGIGMRWAGEAWEIRFGLAEGYYKEHGNLRIPQTFVVEAAGERIWLGKWLAGQKKRRNGSGQKHAMSKEQEKRLEAIGMEW